ncbi:MAG: TIGR03936 family radical SAM-associated protein [Lachnospiraceae bacterium]|nr:TIGR03936 family radical SAM-associated protein [Lachnospiraceae bacterium]
MKVRIKFAKTGAMKFIGHLDVMRYFQKAIRRAGLDAAYSEGYSPHMIMSFAAPLGVGLTSQGEYFDLVLNSATTSEDMIQRLNGAMAEGIQVLSLVQVEDGKASKAMSLVAAADYFVTFREGKEPCADWESRIADYYAQERIPIVKKTKRSEMEVDIKPMIQEMRIYNHGVFLRLATGSANNLKPELVMEGFGTFVGQSLEPFAVQTERLETYAEQEGSLIPLADLGEIIG